MEQQVKLPDAFIERMRNMLCDEYEDFIASYEKPRFYGLRENLLKGNGTRFDDRMPFALTKVNWAKEGYYYSGDAQPGKHVLHEIGAYYIQEPSAMSVIEALDPQPGESILDLCAAPGGKSTQIAGRMYGKGLLIANEIVPNRAKILSQNVERMGISNCVVLNETPDRMSFLFPCFFDRIVVDAPCSGEGMFRKEENAVVEWSTEHVHMCAKRQDLILDEAYKMLKPGGIIVYSTCTFAPDENEGSIERFLLRHTDMELEPISNSSYFSKGKQEWCSTKVKNIDYTARLWPHKLDGEGHFVARMKKSGQSPTEEWRDERGKKDSGKNRIRKSEEHDLTFQVKKFLVDEIGLSEQWLDKKKAGIQLFGEQIYLVPGRMISLKGIKIERAGLQIGTIKKNRMEPSHALALSLNKAEMDNRHLLNITKEEAERYIQGEGISCDPNLRGWVLLCYEDYTVGFGKAVNGMIKNHYPKGLRKSLT